MERNDLIMGIVVVIVFAFTISQFVQCERKSKDLRAKCIMDAKDFSMISKCKEIY